MPHSSPKMVDIVLFGFLLLLIPCRAHNQTSRRDCQPFLSGVDGLLLDIEFENDFCVCGQPCFQTASNGSCELITGRFNCFILQEETTGNFTCSARDINFFGFISFILFAASTLAAAAPFVILLCFMLPYLCLHKKHHGHGRAARSAVTITVASFVVGWVGCSVLIIVGLIIRDIGESMRNYCLKAANG